MIGIIECLLSHHSKRLLCRTLNFNRSSFYDHKKRVDAAEKKSDVEVIDALKAIALKRPYYGYRRITHQLKRQGFNVNHKYVYSIMRKEGLLCRRKRKTIKTTDSNHAKHIYPNLAPKVKVTNINQLWVSDITYIKLEKGFAYFAHIMDTFSRKCIGWDVDVRIDSQLCLNALNMALKNREGTDVSKLIHHSDRGVQYASTEYVELLKANNAIISMSRKGNPYDNPMAERFFKTFKYESLYFNEIDMFGELRSLIDSFVKDYNDERLHSSIGYRPPTEFERQTMLNL